VGAEALVELAMQGEGSLAVEADHVQWQAAGARHEVVPPDDPERALYRGLKRRQLDRKIKRLPVTTADWRIEE
jgi:hypothetical protein